MFPSSKYIMEIADEDKDDWYDEDLEDEGEEE